MLDLLFDTAVDDRISRSPANKVEIGALSVRTRVPDFGVSGKMPADFHPFHRQTEQNVVLYSQVFAASWTADLPQCSSTRKRRRLPMEWTDL